ncbi:lysophospholipid acyltransferase family protein [Sansalvadorimonas sp. 2012CJ34-2]|uniref:L-ornithine N(alpha)-acyltransferase n=1 Tax=Parendozoicomonas callyspongiae TaxID=2942213 RepID=A0ABT0PEA8_9GAMM|nr:GNAT family N-acyltransferase [Sansalvadorimonas sp. 2012CJ34-2]MCL6269709.1 lysophospholipid acyltransferase family protein [Sansalvadorimonas sp. 2012CJ34-2]
MANGSPFRLEFKGHRGLLLRFAEHVLGLRYLDRIYEKYVTDEQGHDFVRLTLHRLNIQYRLTGEPMDNIPKSGPLVVIANHPFGGAEGVVLMDALLKVRPDVRVLSNQLLNSIPGLQSLFIGVDILSNPSKEQRRAANKEAVSTATQWVKEGGALIIFPAGEVSGWDWKTRKLKEATWRHTAGRILHETQANLLPVHVEGRNSFVFYGLGIIHPLLRTMRLVRELINKSGKQITLKLGSVEPWQNFSRCPDEQSLTNAMHLRTILLSNGESKPLESIQANPESPVISPVDSALLERDIAKLPEKNLLLQRGSFEVWCSYATGIPNILREIGRLREITFRDAGEGSGLSMDIDRFDQTYLHLFLWNKEKSEIVGAYRLGQVDKLIASGGVEALYSRSLFEYDRRFLDQMGGCLEMGRSFISKEYQKSLSALQMLWKGIGAWVIRHPQYRVLFGPVSISKEYQELSRYLMAMSLEENFLNSSLAELVKPKEPLHPSSKLPWSRDMLAGLGSVEHISALVRVLENDRGVPVLLRQYLKLNGTFAGFNVDPAFNDALDGLIIVDLLKSDRRVLERYLGEEGYLRLTGFHNLEAMSA